jgi:DNA-binding NarL/FixJ family response regulator
LLESAINRTKAYGSVQAYGYCGCWLKRGDFSGGNWNLAYVKRILIVDDSALIRQGLRRFWEDQSDWEVCGEAENGLAGIEQAKLLHPDIVLLDLSMPVMNGLDAARELKHLMPHVHLVMFTSFYGTEVQRAAVEAGIAVIASKSRGLQSLAVAMDGFLSSSKPTG